MLKGIEHFDLRFCHTAEHSYQFFQLNITGGRRGRLTKRNVETQIYICTVVAYKGVA